MIRSIGLSGRGWVGAVLAAFLISTSFHGAAAGTADALNVDKHATAIGNHSQTVANMASWGVRSTDSGNLPFVVVDKIAATLFVFNPNGTLRASTPVLVGHARGDHSVPGIGQRPIADIRPAERTTPAGRFTAEPGKNLDGEDIIWIDYDAALSIHRVRVGPSRERRLERLASPTSADNRISYGCIVTSVTFYEQVILPVFAGAKRMVYVLPETRSAMEVVDYFH